MTALRIPIGCECSGIVRQAMPPLTYLSVCSGIEAASVAWEPLGWRPWAFSEIDPFPCRVLSHRFGSNMPGEALAQNGVPNLGDMTKFQEWPDGAIDLLVGGTPCQDYSVAGKRAGMAGSRGSLTLTFLEIAARYRPQWVVWENVPGVLSSNGGKDFAAFLWDLGQLGYGWAYRVLDAQFVRTRGHPVAVPQRRRRVFVVGYLGDWRPPAAVFLDAESLRGDPPPRRGAGERPAAATAQGVAIRGREGGGTAEVMGPISGAVRASQGGGDKPHVLLPETICANSGDVGYCLTASAQQSLDAETETLIAVAHTLKAEGFDASEDGTGRGIPLVPFVAGAICLDSFAGGAGGRPEGADVGHFLPVAFDCKGSQVQTDHTGTAPTLRSMGHADSHQNGGGQLAIAIQERAVSEKLENGPQGKGWQRGVGYTLEARNKVQSVATAWSVRRLTPMECERLQGFPDGWTGVPVRGKPAADGPRYKALGNSMAVNVMGFIGQRIELVRAEMAATEATP